MKLGDKVNHPRHGIGTVISLSSRYGEMPIGVNFSHPVEGFANVQYFYSDASFDPVDATPIDKSEG